MRGLDSRVGGATTQVTTWRRSDSVVVLLISVSLLTLTVIDWLLGTFLPRFFCLLLLLRLFDLGFQGLVDGDPRAQTGS